ncbi:unnamed protein product, partial [Closterium sp. NIES-53]
SSSFSSCACSPVSSCVVSPCFPHSYLGIMPCFSSFSLACSCLPYHHPCASPLFVSALTSAIADFATTRRLDFATRVVAAPSARPLSAGGEFALGCDVLEDRQFELEFLAAASPSLYAMPLSPEGDPDALDIPAPRTYREAVLGQ